jgi:hypothetical protein
MKLKKVDTSSRRVILEDQAEDGKTYEISYDSSTNKGEFQLDGSTYQINISGSDIYVDMDADKDLTGTMNYLFTYNGGRITFQYSEDNLSLRSGKYSGTVDRDYLYAGVSWDSDEGELDISDSYSTGYLYGFDAGTLRIVDEEIEEGYSRYGIYAKWDYSDSQTNIKWVYPGSQTFANIYVTGTDSTSSETTTPYSLLWNNISALDSEVTDKTEKNLILVGGPCTNTLTAEVMGNPKPCDKGFEPGKAIIRLYEKVLGGKKSALVIAGYSGQDTRNAASILKDYSDYALSGKEIVVIDKDGVIVVEE